jgi:hypothetical protein
VLSGVDSGGSAQSREAQGLAITLAIVWLASAPSRLSASLRPHTGLAALTEASASPESGIYVMARGTTTIALI